MKLPLASLALAGLAGCATHSRPAGMAAGKFVSFACAEGKTFSARVAEGALPSVFLPIMGRPNSTELADGVYEGDGYKLVTQGSGGITLMHQGKPQGKHCKATG